MPDPLDVLCLSGIWVKKLYWLRLSKLYDSDQAWQTKELEVLYTAKNTVSLYVIASEVHVLRPARCTCSVPFLQAPKRNSLFVAVSTYAVHAIRHHLSQYNTAL